MQEVIKMYIEAHNPQKIIINDFLNSLINLSSFPEKEVHQMKIDAAKFIKTLGYVRQVKWDGTKVWNKKS